MLVGGRSRIQKLRKSVMVALPVVLAGCSGTAICLKPISISEKDLMPETVVPAGCRAVSGGQSEVVEFECENGRVGFVFAIDQQG